MNLEGGRPLTMGASAAHGFEDGTRHMGPRAMPACMRAKMRVVEAGGVIQRYSELGLA